MPSLLLCVGKSPRVGDVAKRQEVRVSGHAGLFFLDEVELRLLALFRGRPFVESFRGFLEDLGIANLL